MTITSRPFHAPKVGRHLQDEPIHYKIVSRHTLINIIPTTRSAAEIAATIYDSPSLCDIRLPLRASQATLSACINSIYLLRNGLTFIALYTDIRLFIVKIILFRQQ